MGGKILVGVTDFPDIIDVIDNDITNTLREIADVEVIDLHKEKDAKPDIVVCSIFGYDALNYDGIRILYTGENLVPDFNLYDYALGFHFLSFGDRYLRFPYYCNYPDVLANDIDTSRKDRGFCAMAISSPRCQDKVREKFFHELSKYKKIDSAGRYLNNMGYQLGNEISDKIQFLSNYKFSFAFENSSTAGYCTEKIVDSFAAGTIPIYWGDPNITEYFYEDSFINVKGVEDFDNAIAKIIELDQNDELFYQMLNRKKIKDEYTKEAFLERLKEWLMHIIEQEKEDAYRRNISPRGLIYLKYFKIIDEIIRRRW